MLKGTTHSLETKKLIKEKIQIALKNGWMGKPLSKETKKKISKVIKKWWKKRKINE